ncbi:hypothetical protein [Streptacidiphilus jiangxiensis]|uniref:Thioesterase-like superfamily protein n=1 Tax=Streptacidiphilus jiangxiensis TaxID=235985 RepID=A0A1H7V9R1_STRJI|nr:hypothetical protein [Streptacidiphilus jiangxiensis]SEM05719.1 hypothetical protein SAMN05414137_117171 [Streptacidiphilus jiangxiensis]
MTEPVATADLIVPPLFNGPPGSANGGYFAGALAGRLPGAPASAVVSLRKPPPLDTPMTVTVTDAGGVVLHHDDLLIGEAAPAALAGLGTPEPVPFEAAKAAEQDYRGLARHPFPGCFACGTGRGEAPGLHLSAGAVAGGAGLHACTWTPEASLAGPDGVTVRREFVWAALDCPGAWTIDLETRDVVLGRITATVHGTPSVGEPCVVTARLIAQDGRKYSTVTALYGSTGHLIGEAEALWIELPPRS